MPENLKIAIVIITYNRPGDMLALAKNIGRLNDIPGLLEEVIVVNNHSTLSYEKTEEYIRNNPHIPFRYYRAEENLGVSRGRNYAIGLSSAPLLVFLDDDALFRDSDALGQIRDIFNDAPAGGRPTGIASFKVFYYATRDFQVNAFPHKQFAARKHLHHFEAPYFVGCAHAIRRTVFDSTGYYPANFFYGMEEYDLSYRTLQAGYSIVYDDRVTILHKESPGGRLPARDKLRGMWVNKSKVAFKYLPQRYFWSTACMWSLEYLKKSGFHLGGWLKGWKEVFTIPRTEKKQPLNAEAMHYLRKNEARLFY